MALKNKPYAAYIENPLEPWEVFQKELLEYLDEYNTFLLQQKKRGAQKRCAILFSFIDYLCGYHPVAGFEDIQFAWCSSKFANYYNSNFDTQIHTTLARSYTRGFFAFIYRKHGIANKKLLGKLRAVK